MKKEFSKKEVQINGINKEVGIGLTDRLWGNLFVYLLEGLFLLCIGIIYYGLYKSLYRIEVFEIDMEILWWFSNKLGKLSTEGIVLCFLLFYLLFGYILYYLRNINKDYWYFAENAFLRLVMNRRCHF